jgi:hypothetical protein
MSIGTVSTIIERIKVATVASPIAVFVEKNTKGSILLNAVFADTVKTKARIESGDDNYIGAFNRTMNLEKIRSFLLKKLKELRNEMRSKRL